MAAAQSSGLGQGMPEQESGSSNQLHGLPGVSVSIPIYNLGEPQPPPGHHEKWMTRVVVYIPADMFIKGVSIHYQNKAR